MCQYNEDCPSYKFCDRLNRKCIDPCLKTDCGLNASCYPENHQAQCKCLLGFQGKPYVGCTPVTTDPCVPNPCGLDAMCENDNGNPICFCPKGLTGNPFEQCSKIFKYNSFFLKTINRFKISCANKYKKWLCKEKFKFLMENLKISYSSTRGWSMPRKSVWCQFRLPRDIRASEMLLFTRIRRKSSWFSLHAPQQSLRTVSLWT